MAKDIECPYCGHEYDLCHDDGAFYTEVQLEEEQCPSCGKRFLVDTNIYFYHEGRQADCLNDENGKHTWGTIIRYDKDTNDYVEIKECKACGAEGAP